MLAILFALCLLASLSSSIVSASCSTDDEASVRTPLSTSRRRRVLRVRPPFFDAHSRARLQLQKCKDGCKLQSNDVACETLRCASYCFAHASISSDCKSSSQTACNFAQVFAKCEKLDCSPASTTALSLAALVLGVVAAAVAV